MKMLSITKENPNGALVDIEDNALKDLFEKEIAKETETDRVQQLMEGLSTATTITQIRAVAKSILDETDGDAV